MLQHLRHEQGFTLIELLITVGIIIILAAIGIPYYLSLDETAKTSEAYTNLDGIRLSQEAYKLVNAAYVDCPTSPTTVVAPALPTVPQPWAGSVGFTAIGYTPSSSVNYVYEVEAITPTTFVAGALGDTDGDTARLLVIATELEGPHVVLGTDPIPAGLVAGWTAAATDIQD